MASDPVTDFTQGQLGASATVGGRGDAHVADEDCDGGGTQATVKQRPLGVCKLLLRTDKCYWTVGRTGQAYDVRRYIHTVKDVTYRKSRYIL